LPGSLGVAVKTVLYLVCGVWHQGFSLRFFVELLAIGPNAMTIPSAGAVCATGLASASLKNFASLGNSYLRPGVVVLEVKYVVIDSLLWAFRQLLLKDHHRSTHQVRCLNCASIVGSAGCKACSDPAA
jgi:hypothetical protein